MAHKKERVHPIESTSLVVGVVAVDSAGGKEHSPGFFVYVWMYSSRFGEVGRRSRDKVDKI